MSEYKKVRELNNKILLSHQTKAEAIVIGSGPAALSAIKVLVENGIRPVVLDVGVDNDLKSKEVIQLSHLNKSPGRKAVFGSLFPYHQVECSNVKYTEIEPSISFAKGGFSNVWGATNSSDFGDWPEYLIPSVRDIAVVEQLMYKSSVGSGFGELNPGLLATDQGSSIRKTFTGSRWSVLSAKLSINQNGSNSCIRCNLCIEGCPRNSIWSSSTEISRLERKNYIDYRNGNYVNKFINLDNRD